MFVKQLTETELNEYERQLEGVGISVKQLTANDELTRGLVNAVIDSVHDLQEQIVNQIAAFHREDPSPTPPDPD